MRNPDGFRFAITDYVVAELSSKMPGQAIIARCMVAPPLFDHVPYPRLVSTAQDIKVSPLPGHSLGLYIYFERSCHPIKP